MLQIFVAIITFIICVVTFIIGMIQMNPTATELFLCSIAAMMICNRYAEN